jgi:hypothetical protein
MLVYYRIVNEELLFIECIAVVGITTIKCSVADGMRWYALLLAHSVNTQLALCGA